MHILLTYRNLLSPFAGIWLTRHQVAHKPSNSYTHQSILIFCLNPSTLSGYRRRCIRQNRFILVSAFPLFEFFLDLKDQLPVLEEVRHGQGQRLGGEDHTLVTDGHAAAGYHRPGMPGRTNRCRGSRQADLRDNPHP